MSHVVLPSDNHWCCRLLMNQLPHCLAPPFCLTINIRFCLFFCQDSSNRSTWWVCSTALLSQRNQCAVQVAIVQRIDTHVDSITNDPMSPAYRVFLVDIINILCIMDAITELVHPVQGCAGHDMQSQVPQNYMPSSLLPAFQAVSVRSTQFDSHPDWETPIGEMDARLYVEANATYRIVHEELCLLIECNPGTLVLYFPHVLSLHRPLRQDINILGMHSLSSWYTQYNVLPPGFIYYHK